MEQIFRLQRHLNIFTLKNIGIDFEKTIRDPEENLTWIENYRKALSAELAELVREVEEHGIGTHNGKVEIVDMLHFLVSLSLLIGIDPQQVPLSVTATEGDTFRCCALRTFLALDDLQNSLKWKWWAKGGGFKPDRAREAVLALWQHFAENCALFDMDSSTLKKIYISKNQVNFMRQNQHYNEDTKTEDDNQSIEI